MLYQKYRAKSTLEVALSTDIQNFHIPRSCICNMIIFWHEIESHFHSLTDCKNALQCALFQKRNFGKYHLKAPGLVVGFQEKSDT